MNKLNNVEFFLNEQINNGVCPGFNYGVISKEEYIGSVGYKALFSNKEENNIDTLYDVASLTKVVATMPAICRLIESKKLNMDDKVSKYLDRFKYDDITIYDLLTHTSGLPADLNNKDIVSKEEIVNKIYDLDLINPTGKKVVYSDIGYILLGFIIEKICNKPLEETIKELVFDPLEMNDTCFNPINKDNCAPTEITDSRGVVRGIVHDEKACSLDGAAGNAGVFSNVKDLMNYVSMILNDGVFNGKQFLNKKTIDLWFKPLVLEVDNNRLRSLCYIVGNNNLVIKAHENVISFNGFTGPSISIDRNNKVGIILLNNRVHPTRENTLLIPARSIITSKIYDELDLIETKEEDQIRMY